MSEFQLLAKNQGAYDLLEHLNDAKFDPTPFIKHNFTQNSALTELANSEGFDFIEEIKGKILEAEGAIEGAEQ